MKNKCPYCNEDMHSKIVSEGVAYVDHILFECEANSKDKRHERAFINASPKEKEKYWY